jgi:hypothetical protein
MNGLDKMIKRERKFKYKRLKKLRKARDMSKHHRDGILKLSRVNSWFNSTEHQEYFPVNLARIILQKYDNEKNRPRPPKPPSVRLRGDK